MKMGMISQQHGLPPNCADQWVKKKQPTRIGEAEIRIVPSSTRAREFESVTACSSIHRVRLHVDRLVAGL